MSTLFLILLILGAVLVLGFCYFILRFLEAGIFNRRTLEELLGYIPPNATSIKPRPACDPFILDKIVDIEHGEKTVYEERKSSLKLYSFIEESSTVKPSDTSFLIFNEVEDIEHGEKTICEERESSGTTGGGGGGGSGPHRDSYHTISGRVQPQPDPEERRRQVAEAAEKRRQEQASRGVKDISSVNRMQKRQDEIEKREEEAARSGQPVLKWQMS